MAQKQPVSIVDSLRKQQAILEDNFQRLQQSLKHWMIEEIEYEGLKEELEQLPEEKTSTADMRAVMEEYGGSVVTRADVDKLLGLDVGKARTRTEVLAALSHRISYSARNSATLQKQANQAYEKLQKTMAVLEPEMTDEDGQPLTEIREELDEDGNIISSSVSNAQNNATEVLSVLEEKNLLADGSKEQTDVRIEEHENSVEPVVKEARPSEDVLENKLVDQPDSASEENIQKDGQEESPKEEKPEPVRPSIEEVARNATSGPSIQELQQTDGSIPSEPKYPEETAAEREIREEMIKYSIEEIGPVVAQLDLEEGFQTDQDDVGEDNDDDDDDLDFDFDAAFADQDYSADELDNDSENEFGISTRSHITDEYRQQMAELEARLSATLIGNAGPNPDLSKLAQPGRDDSSLGGAAGSDAEAEQQAPKPAISRRAAGLGRPDKAAAGAAAPSMRSGSAKKEKKQVSFAAALDVAPSTSKQEEPTAKQKPTAATATATASAKAPRPVIEETIFERKAPVKKDLTAAAPKKKSVFAARREKAAAEAAAAAATTSTAPPDTTPAGPSSLVADTVIERTPSATRVSAPDDPVDELDPGLLQREVVTHFYKHRNRIIQAQGGFTRNYNDEDGEEELEMVEVDDEGNTRPMSRFKAARIRASRMR